MHRPAPRHGQQGFILVTSLVLLVVITLLAISAMNASTLGLRMVTNQQEKSQALRAANAALADVETMLGDRTFQNCTALFTLPDKQTGCGGPVGQLARNVGYSRFQRSENGGWNEIFALNYANDAFWNETNVRTFPMPQNIGSNGLRISYRVDYLSFASQSVVKDGRAETSYYFLITARANGASPAARAITQSVYEINR